MFEALAGKKILVTGGTGFIGRHLIAALLASGISPLVTTRRNQQSPENHENSAANYVALDLLEPDKFEKLLATERPTTIFHLAGEAGKRGGDTKICENLNWRVTERLLETALKFDCGRIVLIGSADEYGHHDGKQHETLSLKPVSPYAVSKAKMTTAALAQFADKLPIVILRLFSVYGAGQPPQMFVAQAIKHALADKVFEMSSGEQKRDLIFVGDVIRALSLAASEPQAVGKVINIGTGTAIALREAARLIWRISGANEENLKIGALTAAAGQNHDTWADVSLAAETLGWQARIPLAEGLRLIIETRKNGLAGSIENSISQTNDRADNHFFQS